MASVVYLSKFDILRREVALKCRYWGTHLAIGALELASGRKADINDLFIIALVINGQY